jgi:HEAT repeat protein
MITRRRSFALFSAICAWLMLAGAPARSGEPSLSELIGVLKSSKPSDETARLKAIDELGSRGQQAAAAVAPLMELLKDGSAKVRAHAARALGEIGAPAKPAVAALAELLKDPDETVRRQAVKAVLGIRPGPQVTVPLCVKLLEDADPGVRMRILHAIAEAGSEAVPGLIEALKNDQAAYWACLVLREIGAAAKDAVPALAERLKDPRPEVRREAVLALAAMDEAAGPALPQIAAALDDEHARSAATYALGRIGKIPADAETKVRANARSDDKMLCTTSLWALARVHPEDKQLRGEATEQLLARLKDQDPLVRVAAARALAALPPAPEITLPIWEKALQGAEETTVQYALDALAAVGAPAVPRLIDALKHQRLRVQVVYVLGQIGADAAPATAALAKLTDDTDDRVAHEAVLALAKIGPGAKAAVPELVKLLKKSDESSAHAAAYALGKIGPGAAAADAALSALLKSPDQDLALVSAWALIQIHPASAEVAGKTVPVLIGGLSAPTPLARQGAAESLGHLGPLAKQAVPALQKLLQDEDQAVRDVAAAALRSIRG